MGGQLNGDGGFSFRRVSKVVSVTQVILLVFDRSLLYSSSSDASTSPATAVGNAGIVIGSLSVLGIVAGVIYVVVSDDTEEEEATEQ